MNYTLNELCLSIVRGPFGSSLKKEFFVNADVNTYKVYEQGNAIRKDKNYGQYYITEDKYTELKRFEVKPLDFIMSCSGTIGELYQLPEDAEVGVINQALLKLTINTDIVDYDYFSYMFRHNLMNLESKGSGIQNVASVKVLKEMHFEIPNKDIQKQIVSTLNKVESIIDLRKQELYSFDDLIKARFIELFENAPTKLVEDVCNSFKIGPFGSALHKNEMSTEGFAFVLGTDNAVKNEFAIKELRYINEAKYTELEKYTVNPQDVIMSMMGTVGRVAVIPCNIETAIISSHLCILRINKEVMYPEFFHLAFSRDDLIQHQIDGIQNGSIMKGFNLKIVKAFKVKCPTLSDQKTYMDFVNQIDKSKSVIQKSLDETQLLFDCLMQEYFG